MQISGTFFLAELCILPWQIPVTSASLSSDVSPHLSETGLLRLNTSSRGHCPERGTSQQKAGAVVEIALFPCPQRSQLCTACHPASEPRCFVCLTQCSRCLWHVRVLCEGSIHGTNYRGQFFHHQQKLQLHLLVCWIGPGTVSVQFQSTGVWMYYSAWVHG